MDDVVVISERIPLVCPYTSVRIKDPVIAWCCVSKHPLRTFDGPAFMALKKKSNGKINCPHCKAEIFDQFVLSQFVIKEILCLTKDSVNFVHARDGQFFVDLNDAVPLPVTMKFDPPPYLPPKKPVKHEKIQVIDGPKNTFSEMQQRAQATFELLKRVQQEGLLKRTGEATLPRQEPISVAANPPSTDLIKVVHTKTTSPITITTTIVVPPVPTNKRRGGRIQTNDEFALKKIKIHENAINGIIKKQAEIPNNASPELCKIWLEISQFWNKVNQMYNETFGTSVE